MSLSKRKVPNRSPFKKKSKKFQILTDNEQKSITCIEDLPKELFYEIFDYLDTFELHQAFSNINNHFQCLLDSVAVRLKPKFVSFNQSNDKNRLIDIISLKRQELFSFVSIERWITNTFCSLMTIDSSFHRLEYVSLIGLDSNKFMSVLPSLATLFNLYSLTISIDDDILDLNVVYQMIFNLRSLKYYKILFGTEETYSALSVVSNTFISFLQYLIIRHSCTLSALISVLSCTLQLSYFNCMHLNEAEQFTMRDLNVNVSNLTSMTISRCCIAFDEFELLIKNVCIQLKNLRLTACNDKAYLDGDRWKHLIEHFMPHLSRFEFKYLEIIEDEFEFSMEHTLVDRFISQFWIKRQWILEIIIDILDWSGTKIIYSIGSYRQRCFEVNEDYLDFNESSPSVVLIIAESFHIDLQDTFFSDFSPILHCLPIRILMINAKDISIQVFIELLYELPNLDSLKICSLSLLALPQLTRTQEDNICSIAKNSKITKINLEQTTALADIKFLVDLCPQVQYFELKDFGSIELTTLVRLFLVKSIKYMGHPCVLCFSNTEANDAMFYKLQSMVHTDKLFVDCIVTYQFQKVYIKLK